MGAWRIERELGKGGMAAVYAVVHVRFGKRAALKLAHRSILGPEFTPDTFLREARIANLIDHAGVPDVFATGAYDGRPYLVMERLSGQTLGERLAARPLAREEALDLLRELCEVLGAAHRVGIVHRDLKLDNVFLLATPGLGGRRVKLLDWGVASVRGEPDPLHGMIAGTLTYLAPEQIRADELTPAADIYALAVIAYQLLLGRPPFAATDDLQLIAKHVFEAPPSPSSLWPGIPAGLDALLTRMLAKHAEDRPTVDDVSRGLSAAIAALGAAVHDGWWLAAELVRPDVIGRPSVGVPGQRQRALGARLAIGLAIVLALANLAAAL